MLTHPGRHIGDSWFFIDGDTAHCFYLACPLGVPRHSDWTIEHAVSRDLTEWRLCGTVVHKGGMGEWDSGCIATGSVLRHEERFWMAYTGNWSGPQPGVGLAVSDDLHHWQKISGGPFTSIDERFYEPVSREWRHIPQWRDPFLFRHDDWIYHYVCATRRDGPPRHRGTLGTARTRDMKSWEVVPPPQIEPVVEELECPQLLRAGDGLYHLVFFALPQWFASHEAAGGDAPTSYAMVAPSPFGPFRLVGDGRVLPLDYPVQPLAAQVVRWKEGPYLIGTLPDDHKGDSLCDPIPLEFTAAGVKVRRPTSTGIEI